MENHDGGRRDEILAAAIDLAHEQGIKGISVRAVAARAGIGPSTLRYYFPSQAELLSDTSRAIFRTRIHDHRINDPAVAPQVRIFECLWQFLAPFDGSATALEAWFETHRQALSPDSDPSIAAFLREAHTFSREIATNWVEILAGEGHIHVEQIDDAVTMLLALVDGLALHQLVNPELPPAQTERALRLAITALFAPAAGDDPARRIVAE